MPRISDIVKHLLILNAILFFLYQTPAATFLPDMALYFIGDTRFSPYQLITHMFMHGDVMHLAMNMFGLYIFGSYVERYIGSQKFFFLYFISGLGALIAHLGVQYYQFANMGVEYFRPVVGASGALMGVVMSFAVLFPNLKLMIIPIPIPIKAKYLAIGYVLFDLYSGVTGAQANVANFAHLGGAITGFIITYFFFKNSRAGR